MSRSILRKMPARFSSINSWGGPKTIGRTALAKRQRKLRAWGQEFKKAYGAIPLSTLGMQRREIKATIKSARRRRIQLPN